jgi:hypothetical protein
VENYSNGLMDGPCYCWKLKNKTDSIVYRTFIQPGSDTIRLNGNYQTGKPKDGTFVSAGAITNYSEGKKEGLTILFYPKENREIMAELQYATDSLHGEQRYHIEDKVFTSIYDLGKLLDGPDVSLKLLENRYKKAFTYFRDGHAVDESIEFEQYYKLIHIVKGHPMDGYIRRDHNTNYTDVYQNGKLILTYKGFDRDTTEKTIYQENTSATFNKIGELIAKSHYTVPFSSGTTTLLEHQEPADTIIFENNIFSKGCIKSSDLSIGFNSKTTAVICVDSLSTRITLLEKNSRLRKEVLPGPGTSVPWPFDSIIALYSI